MPGRFPLYTDADINGPVVQALRMKPGDFVEAFEELARQDNPMAVYPLAHLRPRR